MSAERLRKAADRLDLIVGYATEGPWTVRAPGVVDGPECCVMHDMDARTADAAYIAAMHPGVGKALAAWLRTTADRMGGKTWTGSRQALAVADAILGGAS